MRTVDTVLLQVRDAVARPRLGQEGVGGQALRQLPEASERRDTLLVLPLVVRDGSMTQGLPYPRGRFSLVARAEREKEQNSRSQFLCFEVTV